MQGEEDRAVLAALRDDLFPEVIGEPGVSMRSADGTTPLHVAAIRNDVALAKRLMRLGADLEARADGGYTPLLEAAAQGNREVFDLLLHSGADSGAITDDGFETGDLWRLSDPAPPSG